MCPTGVWPVKWRANTPYCYAPTTYVWVIHSNAFCAFFYSPYYVVLMYCVYCSKMCWSSKNNGTRFKLIFTRVHVGFQMYTYIMRIVPNVHIHTHTSRIICAWVRECTAYFVHGECLPVTEKLLRYYWFANNDDDTAGVPAEFRKRKKKCEMLTVNNIQS